MTTITPVASIEASPSSACIKNTHRRKLSLSRFISEKNFKIYQRKKNSEYLSLLSPKSLKLTRSPTTHVKGNEKMRNIPELLEKSLKAQKKQQYDKALLLIDKALSLNPKSSEAWNRKGFVCHLSDRLCQAIECYDLSIKYNPKNAIAWNNKGGVYLGLEKFPDALLCFNEAVQIDPNYKTGWNNQGVTHRQMGNFSEAFTSHEKALKLDNNDPLTLNQLGRVNFLLADFSAAGSCFDKAIKIDPKYYQALYGKGVLLREMGEHEKALQYFNKAMLINPTYQEDHWISPVRTTISSPSHNFSETESIIQVRSELSKIRCRSLYLDKKAFILIIENK
jgi:tetratricopeptide (TPR) repeat protein